LWITQISFPVIPSEVEESFDIISQRRSSAAVKLPQPRRFFFVAFQLEHHAFNVPVILVPLQEL